MEKIISKNALINNFDEYINSSIMSMILISEFCGHMSWQRRKGKVCFFISNSVFNKIVLTKGVAL